MMASSIYNGSSRYHAPEVPWSARLMIHPLVAQHIPEIQALCHELGVAKLETFSLPHTSSIDLLVTFAKGQDARADGRRFIELEKRLATITGQDINLLTISALRNDWLRHEAWQTRSTLYETPSRYPYAS
jgi:predicted nucleotidyltransferase